jgi:hypothetical protein
MDPAACLRVGTHPEVEDEGPANDVLASHEARGGGAVHSPAVKHPRMGEHNITRRPRALRDPHRNVADVRLRVDEASEARAVGGGQPPSFAPSSRSSSRNNDRWHTDSSSQ